MYAYTTVLTSRWPLYFGSLDTCFSRLWVLSLLKWQQRAVAVALALASRLMVAVQIIMRMTKSLLLICCVKKTHLSWVTMGQQLSEEHNKQGSGLRRRGSIRWYNVFTVASSLSLTNINKCTWLACLKWPPTDRLLHWLWLVYGSSLQSPHRQTVCYQSWRQAVSACRLTCCSSYQHDECLHIYYKTDYVRSIIRSFDYITAIK